MLLRQCGGHLVGRREETEDISSERGAGYRWSPVPLAKVAIVRQRRSRRKDQEGRRARGTGQRLGFMTIHWGVTTSTAQEED